MGNKKKKYNARFHPGRIKKIMQTDEEVGKIAAPVPVVISRALELFLESMITKCVSLASDGNAKTLTTSHIRAVIESDKKLAFLASLVTKVPELSSTSSIRQDSSDGSDSTPLTNESPLPSTSKLEEPVGYKKRKIVELSCPETPRESPGELPKKRRGRPPKVKIESPIQELKKEQKDWGLVSPSMLSKPSYLPPTSLPAPLHPFPEHSAPGDLSPSSFPIDLSIRTQNRNSAPYLAAVPSSSAARWTCHTDNYDA